MSKITNNEAAFPIEYVRTRRAGGITEWHMNKGMSKRFYAACAAMQGIISNEYWISQEKSINYERITEISYKMADELLKQENI